MAAVRSVRPVTESWPAAASSLLRPLLARPAMRCAVVASSRTAVHLATGDPDAPVLSVVAPGGACLPGGVVLADPDGVVRLGTAGDALVGDGAVQAGEDRVTVRRWWSQPLVRLVSEPSQLVTGAGALATTLVSSGLELPALVQSVASRLAAAIDLDDESAIRSAVHAMIGLGPGLTPAADDVLVGALVAWHHLAIAGWSGAVDTRRPVSVAVQERLERTTVVSAALLHHASRGESLPEVLLLLDAVCTPRALPAALDAIARVGPHTGPSMAYGVQLGRRAVLAARAPERVAR